MFQDIDPKAPNYRKAVSLAYRTHAPKNIQERLAAFDHAAKEARDIVCGSGKLPNDFNFDNEV